MEQGVEYLKIRSSGKESHALADGPLNSCQSSPHSPGFMPPSPTTTQNSLNNPQQTSVMAEPRSPPGLLPNLTFLQGRCGPLPFPGSVAPALLPVLRGCLQAVLLVEEDVAGRPVSEMEARSAHGPPSVKFPEASLSALKL